MGEDEGRREKTPKATTAKKQLNKHTRNI